jgi:hypothetical protein
MMHLTNNKKNNSTATAASTLLTLAIIVIIVPSMASTLVAATTLATTPSPSTRIELSPQPIYQERLGTVRETPINHTHISITCSGNGMLTLPNTTETINTTANVSAISHL